MVVKQAVELHWFKNGFANYNMSLAAETFMSLPGGVTEVIWISGIYLGRYWTMGP
ncbi:hypothetical protein B0H66DRAFT_546544 [Apodospora peruviana]|uniref:Uncharacterized protein n=1 Tax=Apodospora peruviana TaxID=516989 RepID=A0AAE0IUD3_9PEZI|nr:hypothetical protein B0H66DRAFT_546544 [Apodospora peruviana]